ncbi:hypothetical protein [Streptomyces yaizuensis]|uniref:Uncharacterized protein n=1 Tax=Streptomyces yaizuensis TaxID=2989713 RepID=A0ABQ5P643_9ACTN|nr:hypothetical protein [Streptomyces sp. YSPA8]GLF98071.1 hypothetical protein SYYSPA8_27260 [Streptomyces sp. YSPA8]
MSETKDDERVYPENEVVDGIELCSDQEQHEIDFPERYWDPHRIPSS